MGWYFLTALICGWAVTRCARDAASRWGGLLIFLGLGLIHGIVPLLRPEYRIGSWVASDQLYERAAPLTFLGVGSLILGYFVLPGTFSKGSARQVSVAFANDRSTQNRLWRFAFVAGLVGVSGTLLTFVASAGSVGAYTSGSRFEYRFSGGILGLLGLHLLTLTFVPGFVGSFLSSRLRSAACYGFAIAFGSFYYFATRGTRSIPLGLLAGVLAGLVMAKRPSGRAGVVIVSSMLVGALVSAGLYNVRSQLGRLDAAGAASALLAPDTYRGAADTDPLNYHAQFLGAVGMVPSSYPYFLGDSYLRIATVAIPSSVIPGVKPADTHSRFAAMFLGKSTKVTIPPSLIGDVYLNLWGIPGLVLLGLAWGYLVALVDRRLEWDWWLVFWFGPASGRLALLLLRGQPYEVAVIAFATWLLSRSIAHVVNFRPWIDSHSPEILGIPAEHGVPAR